MDPLDLLPSQSRVMADVVASARRLVQRVGAGGQLPSLLVLGETGTGKTRLAGLLHRMSPRGAGPFVDCRLESMPDSLVESELFGYEKGAFTGALQSRQGLFHASHGGTLLLDEIGVAPPALQVKLLKAVEERVVRRVGGSRDEPFDAWIISATNEDLLAAIRERRFREDLYHRLAVVTLRIPPLRERREDILPLARHFLARTAEDYRLGRLSFTEAAEAKILAYAWPGNVRELANTIERAALLTESSVLDADDLDVRPMPETGGAAAPAAFEARVDPPPSATPNDTLRERLQTALDRNAGNISHAARELGIARNTLRGHIQRLKLRTVPPGTAPRPRQSRKSPVDTPVEPLATATPAAPGVADAVAARVVAGPPRSRALAWERHLVAFLTVVLEPPADVIAAQLAPILAELADKLEPFGGRVRDVRPLGLTIVFGAEPIDDLPRRAANAALAAQKVIERAAVGPLAQLVGRVVVHTADCLVAPTRGAVGIDPADESAARATLDGLLAVTAPSAIVVSPPASRMLERRFELVPVDGADALRLVGHERTGLESGSRRSSPFVGRVREMAALADLLHEAESGRGQIIGVAGEPGVGKTRLIHEFCRLVVSDRLTQREGRCVPHGTTSPYHPLIDILRQVFELDDLDAEAIVVAKVRRVAAALDLDVEEVAPCLLHLLGIAAGTGRLAGSSPEAIRQRTVDAIRRLALAGSRRRPVVILVEDLQWIDRTSEVTLNALADSLANAPILLLTSFRPGYQPPWATRSNVTQLALQPLNPEDSLTLVRALTADEGLDAALSERILARAGGVPLFLEELARAVTEQPDLVADVIPDTIQATLAARLGRLAPADRALLQTASVIGKDVVGAVLSAVAGVIDEPLRESLGRLEQAEFLFEVSTGSPAAYTFKHALTQEAAYRTLPEEMRRVLHGRVVEALERVTPEVAERRPEIVAHHCTLAGLTDEAIGHWYRAGQRAIQRSANVEAIAHLTTGLRLLESAPAEPMRHLRELGLQVALSTALSAHHGYGAEELERTIARVRVLADELGDAPELVPVRVGLWRFSVSRADFATAESFSTKILSMGESRGDAQILAPGHATMSITSFYRGRFTKTREHVLELQRLRDPSRGPMEAALYGQELGPPTMGFLAWAETLLGHVDRGARTSDLSVEQARAGGHPFTLALTLITAGLVRCERRERALIERHGEELITLSEQQGFRLFTAFGLCLVGYSRFLGGDHDGADPLLREGIERYTAAKQRVGLRFRAMHAELLIAVDKIHEALATLDVMLSHVVETGQHGSLPEGLRMKAHALARRSPDDPDVEALLTRAVDIALSCEADLLALRAATSLATLCRNRPIFPAALARLRDVLGRCAEGSELDELAAARAALDAAH